MFTHMKRHVFNVGFSKNLEISLDRCLESHLPGVRPTATDADPWQAYDPTHPARRADLALIAHSGAHPSTILIDVTIATQLRCS